MKNHRFTATAPDGTVCTRASKTKSYQYAVLVNDEITPTRFVGFDVNGKAVYEPNNGWGAWSWSGSLDNARKAAATAHKAYYTVQIIPVDNPRPTE